MNKLILTTGPHGAHTLRLTEGGTPESPIGNALFELEELQGKIIGFTGEELDSLATKWLTFRTKTKNVRKRK